MDFCLCFACTHTSHCVSSWIRPSISDRIAAGCRCANRRCHSLDSEIAFDPGRAVSVFDPGCAVAVSMDLFLFLLLFPPSSGDATGGSACRSDAYADALRMHSASTM